MGDYFKPWRRKIGVATLVMACVFMGGWLRSITIFDVWLFLDSPMLKTRFISQSTSLELQFIQAELPFSLRPCENDDFSGSIPSNQSDPNVIHFAFAGRGGHKWMAGSRGFGIGVFDAKPVHGLRSFLLMIPYWSITIPLTLISAYLLLAKPRTSTTKKTDELISNEGT